MSKNKTKIEQDNDAARGARYPEDVAYGEDALWARHIISNEAKGEVTVTLSAIGNDGVEDVSFTYKNTSLRYIRFLADIASAEEALHKVQNSPESGVVQRAQVKMAKLTTSIIGHIEELVGGSEALDEIEHFFIEATGEQPGFEQLFVLFVPKD